MSFRFQRLLGALVIQLLNMVPLKGGNMLFARCESKERCLADVHASTKIVPARHKVLLATIYYCW